MAIQIKLPELGEGIDEGQVVSLLVKDGDVVKSGQALIEVESGKATVEVPAERSGRVTAIHVKEGDAIKPGDPIVSLEPDDADKERKEKSHPEDIRESAPNVPRQEASDAKKPSEETEGEESEPAAEKSESGEPAESVAERIGLVMATPSVRKLARELGVNVRAMAGSGPGGRITEHDVKQMAHELIMTGSGSATGALSPYLGEAPSFDAYGPVRYEKMNAIRRETAKHMAASWSAIPHVTNFDKADFSQVTAAREALAAVNGRKVGLTAILLKVLARALRVHPRFNACIDMDRQQIMYREYVNIGVAADTPRGLLVPVIRNVDTKDVKIIHEELADKAERARAGKLPPEEMQGGGFTLSNLGGLGGGWFTPIIHAPEVAILGVGTARTEALYEDGEWKPRSLCPLSLSYDHRLIDGADAARFLRWFVGALENPLIALLEGD